MTYALAWLVMMNVLAFAAFADDKRRARLGLRRIPEHTLLSLAALGGSAGAWAARRTFRHKTRKQPFSTWLWLIAAAQTLATAVYLGGRLGGG